MANEVFLTQKGFDDLEKELDYLRAIKRHEVAQKIKTAREFGDLSENAEYDAAKEEQAQVEGKIQDIEQRLKLAVIINENASTDFISPGCSVTLLDMEDNFEEDYKVVGVTEADVSKNWISNASPIGEALLGKRVGDVVEVKAPGGIFEYKIIKIFR